MTDDRNRRFVQPLVEALAALGVRHAVVSPGSRNTPLSLALAAAGDIDDHSMHDERSAAFLALGIARATGVPVVVTCTSGTAAAEFHPAVVEASAGRVPLIVITADRPADLRDVGAPQAIDQVDLYGRTVRWSHDMEVPAPGDTAPGFPGALAAHLWAEAMSSPQGPVHLNLRMREPLLPEGEAPQSAGAPPRVDIGHRAPGDEALRGLAEVMSGRRVLMICGPHDDPALPAAAAALAGAMHTPVLADPLSGLRSGPFDRTRVLDAGDLLAAARWMDGSPPDVIMRTGALPTSKALWSWLATHPEIPQVLVDEAGWRDPLATVSHLVRADPTRTLAALGEQPLTAAPEGWADGWHRAAVAARAAVADVVSGREFPTEPGVVEVLADTVPDGATLWAASSMPVRDVDMCFAGTDRAIRILANRGANGIDGFLSTGFGHALATGRPTYLLAGDLSVLHDLTALAAAARLGIGATVVAVNNDGGGIFEMLGHAELERGTFERHFGTPHGLDLTAASEALGVEARRAEDRPTLAALLRAPTDRPRLIEVRTDRQANAALHREIRAAVRAALAALVGTP